MDDLFDASPTPSTFSDRSVTRFYYDQSSNGSDALIVYGQTYPYVHVTDHDEAHYYKYDLDDCTATTCAEQYGGNGLLTQEVLDRLDPNVDLSQFDQNGDGKIDYIYLLVRETPRADAFYYAFANNCRGQDPTRVDKHSLCDDMPRHTAVSHLSSFSGSIANTRWPNGEPSLSYDGKQLDWSQGTIHYVRTPFTGTPALVKTIAHEIGHDVWSDFYNHLGPLYPENDVPGNELPSPTWKERLYGYNLMGGWPWPSRGVGGSFTASAHERRVRGWIQPQLPTQSNEVVTLGDLYATGASFQVPLPNGWTLNAANRQRVGYFDQVFTDYCVQTCGSSPVQVDEGLATTGLVIEISNGERDMDIAPADNDLEGSLTFDGYVGDLYGPGTGTQITPWTRPNSNGFNDYDKAPSGYTPGWHALDNIRYTGGGDGEMAFDYHADYRNASVLYIRKDSWMDAASNNLTFAGEIRVTNQATLTIHDGITLTFDDDLVVEAGARLNVGTGVELRFAPGKRIVNAGDFDADGVVFTPDLATSGWGGVRYEPGSTGTLSGSVVEGVSGWGSYAVRINNASPTITGSQIRDSATPSASGGVYVTGSSADPYLFGNTVEFQTSYGIVVTGSASARLRTNVVENNTGEGLFVGAFSEAFVYGQNTFSNNGREGIESARGQVYLGRFYYPQSGYHADGYNLIELNGTHGLLARSQGAIGAGNSDRGRYNRVLDNVSDEARAEGTSSSVLASTNWWGQPVANTPSSVLTTAYTRETSGGSVTVVDVCDTEPGPDLQFGPPSTDPPGCLNPLSTSTGFSRTAGGASLSSARLQGRRLGMEEGVEDWAETVIVDPWGALDHLDAVASAGGPDALAALTEMVRVADHHDYPLWLDTAEPDAPQSEMPPRVPHDGAALRASTRDRLEVHAAGERTSEQAWAQKALIETHLRGGALQAALREADRLLRTAVRLGDDERTVMVGFAYATQVYARAEAGDVEGAEAALAAWRAVSPDDPEVALATDRLALAREGAGGPARTAPAPVVQRAEAAEPEAFGLGAPYPNPAGATVTVPLALAEAAEARVVVYDVLGRTVAVLADGRREAGAYDLTVATDVLAAGVYVVRAVSGTATAVQTFTVAR